MKRIASIFLALLLAPLASAASYYVATNGSDSNPGTEALPFATVTKARDVIRGLGTDGHTVYLRGGTYTLTAPLSFNYQDSGASGLVNVYRNYPGEQPVLSGGQTVTATWTVYSGNIWKCNVGSLRTNSLFVDGARATRAREPDTGYYITQAPSGGYNWITFSGTNINPNWTNLTSVEIVSLDEYTAPRQQITSVSGQTCNLNGNAAYQIWAGNRYWVENVFEGLDTAGEWYLNNTTGDLYYYPLGGKNPNTSAIVAGQRGSVAVWYQGALLDVQGTSSNYAQYLEFRGLTFRDSEWYLPAGGIEGWSEFGESQNGTHASPNWYGQAPGVELRGVRYVTFSDCTVTHIGGNGVRVYGDHVTVQNCSVSDIGSTGIMLGAPSTGDSGAVVTSSYNTVQGNTVHDCGVVLPVGDGILAMIGGHNLITHNRVYNIPFMGINTGRAQAYGGDNTYNTVTYNEVYNAVWQVGDAAAIYFAGTQTGTVAHHNKVHDCPSLSSPGYPYPETGGYAFYLDEAASGITIERNWIYRCNVGLRINSAVSDVFHNNVIATAGYTYYFCNGTPGTTVTHNIYYNTTSTPVGIYNSVTAIGAGNANYNDLYNTLTGFQNTWDGYVTQAHNYSLDLNSITGNPLFVNAAADNYNVEAESPALDVGFEQIDMTDVGPPTTTDTWYVDGTNGSNSYDGKYATFQGGSSGPFLTIAKAMTVAVTPGDMVYVRTGTYQEGITFAASGASGQPITVRNYGTEAVTLSGSNTVAAGAWTKCTSSGDAHGNPNWAHLYKANLPAGTRWLNSNLFQDTTRLMLAQDGEPSDRYWVENVDNYHQLATQGSVTQTTITDTNLDSYGGASLVTADAYVIVWCDGNSIRMGRITGWDAGTHKITFTDLTYAPYYWSGHYYYSIINSWTSEVFDKQGEYWVAYDEVSGQRECLVWPWDEDDLAAGAATITATASQPSINFGTRTYCTVQGLTFSKGYGRAATTTGNHCQIVNCSFPSWSAIGEQDAGNVGYTLYAGDGAVDGSYTLFDGCSLTDYIGNNHGLMLGGSAAHSRVTNCTVDYQSGTGIINFASYVEISHNVVKNCRGPHANGITGAYLGAHDVLIAHNYIYDSANGLTLQNCGNVTVYGNVIDGGTHAPQGYAMVDWGGSGGVWGYWRILHNTILRANATDMCVVCWADSPTDWTTIVVANNLIGDAQFWGNATKIHNNNRYLDAPEGYTMGGSESVTTYGAAIVNYGQQSYDPVDGGSLANAAADVTAYLDTANFPNYNFNVDLADRTINWPLGGVEIGAYQMPPNPPPPPPPPAKARLMLRSTP
jgi:hypothetical protein